MTGPSPAPWLLPILPLLPLSLSRRRESQSRLHQPVTSRRWTPGWWAHLRPGDGLLQVAPGPAALGDARLAPVLRLLATSQRAPSGVTGGVCGAVNAPASAVESGSRPLRIDQTATCQRLRQKLAQSVPPPPRLHGNSSRGSQQMGCETVGGRLLRLLPRPSCVCQSSSWQSSPGLLFWVTFPETQNLLFFLPGTAGSSRQSQEAVPIRSVVRHAGPGGAQLGVGDGLGLHLPPLPCSSGWFRFRRGSERRG